MFEVALGQHRVLDIGLGCDVLQLESQTDDAESALGCGSATETLDRLVHHGHEGRVGLVLRFSTHALGGRVECVGVLGVLAHGHLAELGDHRVGGGTTDVGQGQRRLVGGDGQVLNGGGSLKDLHVL